MIDGLNVLNIYEDKVLDLSRRNRLLRYPKGARSVNFLMDLTEFQEKFGLLEELNIEFSHKEILKEEEETQQLLLKSDTKVTEEDLTLPTTPKGKKLITSLSALRLDTKRKFEEHGLHTLFIAIGKIKWNESRFEKKNDNKINKKKAINEENKKKDEFDYVAPLILIPVQLSEKKNPKQTIINTYLETSDIAFNIALNLLLEKNFGTTTIKLNEELLIDLPKLFNDVSNQLKKIFGEIKVPCEIVPEIQLGQYTFYGQQIYEDLVKNEEKFLENEFLNALCNHAPLDQSNLSIESDDPNHFLRPETDFNVMESDTSQLRVIQEVLIGKHLNIQGPPGTGKTQTIVNIISNLLARNKSVLVVCEKNVALKNVLDRLKDRDLDKLCLPLFQYNEDKKIFAKKVIEDRDYVVKLKYDDYDLNNVLVHREKRIIILKNYANALGEIVEPLHKNTYWVHGELSRHQQLIKSNPLLGQLMWVDKNPLEIIFDEYQEILSILDNMKSVFNLRLDEKHTHWEKINRNTYSKDLELKIGKMLSKLSKHLDKLDTNFEHISFQSVFEIREYIKYLDRIKETNTNIGSFGFDRESDIEEIELLLHKTFRPVEEYITSRDQLGKIYKTPASWNDDITFETNTLLFENQIELSQLSHMTEEIDSAVSLIDDINQSLNKLNASEFLKNEDLVKVLASKDILKSFPVISKLRKWKNLEDVISTLQQLNNLSDFDQKLKRSKKVFDDWGIIVDSLNENHKTQANKFLDKYSNPINRFPFLPFSEYKSDKRLVEDWTIARKPSNYSEYKEVAEGVSDWYAYGNKLELLSNHFSKEHLNQGSSIAREHIEPLFLSVQIIHEYLRSQDEQKLSPNLVSLLEKNKDHADLINNTIDNLVLLSDTWDRLKDFFNLKLIEKENFKELEYILSRAKIQLEGITSTYEDVRKLLNDNHPKILAELANDVEEIKILRRSLSNVQNQGLEKVYSSPRYSEKIIEDLDNFKFFYKELALIRKLLEEIGIKEKQSQLSLTKAMKIITELKEKLPNLLKWIEEYDILNLELDEVFNSSNSIGQYEALTFQKLSSKLSDMEKDSEGLEKWTVYRKYSELIEQRGYRGFLGETKRYRVDNPASLFAVSLWNAWLMERYQSSPILRDFNVKDHEKIIKEFRQLDRQTLEINSKRVLRTAAEYLRKSKMQNGWRDQELVHQSQLKMRHKPIRKLVSSNGQQILNYKRCWLMSPLTLSSYVPFGTIDFDVVIFDEASQLRVEHSLGAIARAKQVVIFGDENQLPPTPFFQIVNNDEDEEEQEEDYESILNATKEILPDAYTMLMYHYRSKYEDLIAFSNYFIYGSQLITFPNPTKGKHPVEFDYVKNGKFDGGAGGSRTNVQEAKRVAEICIKHAKEEPEKTLGVIAFSRSQEEAIREEVNQQIKELPELKTILDEDSEELEKFFIKNLESVQGDERDVIILSVGYGKDKNGKMYQRFGPINNNNGFRRLNVAVTRAKNKVICVSSIKATDIINAEKTSRGVFLLQRYLDYAEHGRDVLDASKLRKNRSEPEYGSPFEEEVANAIQSLGYIVDSQVGASGYKIDLAIVNPKNEEEYILAIECDGAQYHSSYSARINDRIREENLKDKGWEMFRIWSQHWIRDRERIMDELVNKLVDLHSSRN